MVSLKNVNKVIELEPDLLLLSYGLNDSRGGTPPEVFRRAYQELIDRIRAKIDPIIVILNTYYMHEVLYNNCPHWEESDYSVTEVYNLVIRQIAQEYDALVADIWSAEGQAPWVISADTVHANDLGYTLIGNRVFETVATNCSGAAAAIRTPEEETHRLVPELQRQAAERGKKRE